MRNRLAPIVFSFSALIALLAVVYLVSCGSAGRPDRGACRAAMSAQFDAAIANPDGPEGTKPRACEGISDQDLTQIAGELIEEKMVGVLSSAWPTP
jgi:hypothetical protein